MPCAGTVGDAQVPVAARRGDVDHARALRFGQAEAGVVHRQRVEDALLQEALERLPGDHLDHPRQQFQRGAVVAEARPRVGGQRHVAHALGKAAQVGRAVRVDAFHQRDRRLVALAAGRVTGGVSEQRMQGDRLVGRTQFRRIGGAADQHLRRGEAGQVARQRILQRELAFLHQHHHRDRGHRLGHRVDAEDRVPAHRFAPCEVAMAIGLPVHEAAVARHQGDATEVAVVAGGVAHVVVQPLQARRGDALRVGAGFRQRRRRCGGLRQRHAQPHRCQQAGPAGVPADRGAACFDHRVVLAGSRRHGEARRRDPHTSRRDQNVIVYVSEVMRPRPAQ